MQRTEVVIVGAGFTGLAAASEFKAAGIDFRLLEARDRVGGRVEGARNGLGERVDLGGQFFCEDMPGVMALAQQYGKTLVTTPFEGDSLLQPASRNGHDIEEAFARAAALRQRMRAIDPADPAIAGLTASAWAERQETTPEARHMFLSMVEGLWCKPAEAIPFWYVASNDQRITNKVSELQYFAGETLHSLAEDMARSLGSGVETSQPVERIVRDSDGVTVEGRSRTYQARHAILAVPPVMVRKIAFEPGLPPSLREALAAWESGTVVKSFLRYPSAFWRRKGLSGSVLWLDRRGLYVCDASPDEDHAMLVAFAGGPIATLWMANGEAMLRRQLLSRLVPALGPEAAEPLDFICRDWSGDRWSGGGYSDDIMDMAARDAEDVLRRGLAEVSFASSELSPSFPSYVEGAITIGRLQARAVIARFSAAAAEAPQSTGANLAG
ncbi:flavin monoamine oxidase family protein [Labrys okinawensis]|uniref:flavin monoamine oxidase family protein n=1 Tax=Labrys okinawensis TaxID=346911 RepID=UPI0039BD73B3